MAWLSFFGDGWYLRGVADDILDLFGVAPPVITSFLRGDLNGKWSGEVKDV